MPNYIKCSHPWTVHTSLLLMSKNSVKNVLENLFLMFGRGKTQNRAKTHRPSTSAFSAIFVLMENGTQSHCQPPLGAKLCTTLPQHRSKTSTHAPGWAFPVSFFSHTFQSDQSLPRALGFILCAAWGSVILLHAARVLDYFVVIEIAFMDNQAQMT